MESITVATIEEILKTGRLIEARSLLTVHESSFSEEQRQLLRSDMDERQARAEAMLAEAEILEREGRIEEAMNCCDSILAIAHDFPGLDGRRRHLEESLQLTRAVQHRSRRIRQTATPAQHKGSDNRSRGPLVLALGAGIAIGLATLFLFAPRPEPPTAPAPPAASPAPQPPPAPAAEPTAPQASATLDPQAPEQASNAPSVQTMTEPTRSPEQSVQSSPESSPKSSMVETASEAGPAEKVLPPPSQPVASPPPPAPVVVSTPSAITPPAYHRVQAGESLSLIADRLFCNEGAWRDILARNQDKIADPKKMRPGTELNLRGIDTRCPTPSVDNRPQ